MALLGLFLINCDVLCRPEASDTSLIVTAACSVSVTCCCNRLRVRKTLTFSWQQFGCWILKLQFIFPQKYILDERIVIPVICVVVVTVRIFYRWERLFMDAFNSMLVVCGTIVR